MRTWVLRISTHGGLDEPDILYTSARVASGRRYLTWNKSEDLLILELVKSYFVRAQVINPIILQKRLFDNRALHKTRTRDIKKMVIFRIKY